MTKTVYPEMLDLFAEEGMDLLGPEGIRGKRVSIPIDGDLTLWQEVAELPPIILETWELPLPPETN